MSSELLASIGRLFLTTVAFADAVLRVARSTWCMARLLVFIASPFSLFLSSTINLATLVMGAHPFRKQSSMASSSSSSSSSITALSLCFFLFLCFLLIPALFLGCNGQPLAMTYHRGVMLTGQIPVELVFYGKFTASQRAILSDFVVSLSPLPGQKDRLEPSVGTWWNTLRMYYTASKTTPPPRLVLGRQIVDESYSLGKSLRDADLAALAARGGAALSVVLTAADVAVERFCMSRCGSHTSAASGRGRIVYIWVGDSSAQCPGQCAWPFHQPLYGPQTPPLVAPNGDVGADGMVINLASMLAGAATNPFGDGFYQGPREAPLEAATACTGVYAKGAYPGYPGNLLVDPTTGASFNAYGASGRKFLVPGLFDPSTSTCSTLV